MKQTHRLKTTQWFGKMIRFLVVLLLLSACQPLNQPASPAKENNRLITSPVAKSTSTPTVAPSSTPETQAVQPLIEADAGALPQPFDPTGNIAQADAPLLTAMVKANTGEDMVNVRSGPGAVYGRIGALKSSQTVIITGRSAHWDWLRIHTDQIDGWVYSAYLTVDSVAGVPCVEQQAGDCETSGLPVENDQAIDSIRAFRNDNNLNVAYKGEERNPNADLRKAFIYQDDQGSEYWVDQATLLVVQWTPKLIGPTGTPLSADALRTQARNFAFQQSPWLAQNANNLTFTENTKDPTTLALRWEDRSVASHTLFPFLQIILRNDGHMIGYMNTLDVLSK